MEIRSYTMLPNFLFSFCYPCFVLPQYPVAAQSYYGAGGLQQNQIYSTVPSYGKSLNALEILLHPAPGPILPGWHSQSLDHSLLSSPSVAGHRCRPVNGYGDLGKCTIMLRCIIGWINLVGSGLLLLYQFLILFSLPVLWDEGRFMFTFSCSWIFMLSVGHRVPG